MSEQIQKMNLSEGTAVREKKETKTRNLSGRTESHSINENDRWVFDDLGCNILEEAGLRRSISRRSRCLFTRTDFIGQNSGGRKQNSGWRNVKEAILKSYPKGLLSGGIILYSKVLIMSFTVELHCLQVL